MLQPICNRVLQCCVFIVYITITLKYSQLLHSSCTHFSHFRGIEGKRKLKRTKWCPWQSNKNVLLVILSKESMDALCIPEIRFNSIHRGYSIRLDFIFIFSSYFHIFFIHSFMQLFCIHQITYRIKCDALHFMCLCMLCKRTSVNT